MSQNKEENQIYIDAVQICLEETQNLLKVLEGEKDYQNLIEVLNYNSNVLQVSAKRIEAESKRMSAREKMLKQVQRAQRFLSSISDEEFEIARDQFSYQIKYGGNFQIIMKHEEK